MCILWWKVVTYPWPFLWWDLQYHVNPIRNLRNFFFPMKKFGRSNSGRSILNVKGNHKGRSFLTERLDGWRFMVVRIGSLLRNSRTYYCAKLFSNKHSVWKSHLRDTPLDICFQFVLFYLLSDFDALFVFSQRRKPVWNLCHLSKSGASTLSKLRMQWISFHNNWIFTTDRNFLLILFVLGKVAMSTLIKQGNLLVPNYHLSVAYNDLICFPWKG